MERSIPLMALALFVVQANAQIHPIELPPHPEVKDAVVIPSKITSVKEKSGNSYYFEDFDAGLNGWTTSTLVGNLDWVNTNVGPGTTTSTYPVPALNTSTPGGWMMVDDDLLGTSGVMTESWLVSPVIDLSGAPAALKVEFDQYFQEWQTDTCFVGVSTDGGNTWNEVSVNDGVGRDGRPNPELMDVDISSWVAADPSNVQLRFKYVATWDYGWQIDNVTITDLPNNDMALLNARSTMFDFPGTNLSVAPYSIYPVTQVVPMEVNGRLKNKGFAQQTNVQLNVEVTGPNGVEFNGSSTPTDYSPGQDQSQTVFGFTPSAAIGDYTIAYEVTQDQVDDIPADNTDSIDFAVSQNVYAMDRGAADGSLAQGANNLNDQYELGNFFEFSQPGDEITHVQIAIDSSSALGTLIYGVVYDPNLNGAIEYTNDHTLTAADLTAPGGANFITLPLISPIQAITGEFYCVMAGHYGGVDDVAISTSGTSVEQVSIIRYPVSDENFFVTRTPMVRALIGGDVGIEEDPSSTSHISLAPNPFHDNITLKFELDSTQEVNLEVQDLTGRTVHTQALGKRSARLHQVQLNGEAWNSGAYVWKLVTGEVVRSGRMVRN